MPLPWYQIKPRAAVTTDAGTQTSAEVLIYGDIGESWYEETVAAKDFVKAIAELDVDELIVRINSLGGSVPDGLAIHNALKRHRAVITTCNDGTAMSISSLIFMAGDKRQMAENALMMVHAPWWYVGGNANELREYADQLDKWAEAMASSYATASGKPKDEVLAILTDGKDHYFTAEEALAEGYVTEVTTSTPAAAAAALRMVAQSRYHPAASGEQRADVSTLPDATGKQSTAAAAAQSNQEQHMPHPNNPAAPDAAAEAARKEALAADKARREGIRAAAKPFASRPGVSELVQTLEDDHTVTAEAAGLKILAHLAQGVTPIAGSHVETVEDETDKRHAGIIQALMVRAGVADAETRKAVASGNPWRGDTLLDIAKASLDHAGVKYRGKDKMEIVAAAFTQGTSDFPILLENAMHKTLQAAY
ncbi:MAG: Clp protease ClpP, partial [Zoogloea sp.]|nr:Clp protease ClpP [Zoogloea sp.]